MAPYRAENHRTAFFLLSLIALLLHYRPGSAETPQVSPRHENNATVTHLYLDFEDDDIGFRQLMPFGKRSLLIERSVNQRYNRSKGSLHIFMSEGQEGGSIGFYLEENGYSPIKVTPRTTVAWSWKVSKVVNTNGFHLLLHIKNIKEKTNRKNKKLICIANWLKYTNNVLNVYYDPPNTWVFHSERIYDFIWKVYGPFNPGDYIIEGVGFGISFGPGVEGWVDNIWIGEGDPPPFINTIEEKQPVYNVPSGLTGFSFGFIDNDNIPDRVDIFRDRIEIFLNPGTRLSSKQHAKGTLFTKNKPDWKTPLDPQRNTGFATIADLDNDGFDDILLQFDDPLGNILLRNNYVKGKMENRSSRLKDLRQIQGRSYGSVTADIDGDGDLDVLQTNPFEKKKNSIFGGLKLFRNEGDLAFHDITSESYIAPQASFSASFADLNGDLRPDLFVPYRNFWKRGGTAGEPPIPLIYLSDQSGKLHPCFECLKLSPRTYIEGGVFADFDNDADLDLYLVVSEIRRGPKYLPPVNRLFFNDGTGRFIDRTEGSGVACSLSTQAALAEDFDLDGDIDLYVINGNIGAIKQENFCSMYWNNGDGTFTRDSGTEFELTEAGYGGAAVDYDMDGDIDIAVLGKNMDSPILLENLCNLDGFIEVRVRGARSNRDGIGAKVFCYEEGFLDDQTHLLGFREISASKGFAQCVPPVAHFGIGNRERVDVKVVFPFTEDAQGPGKPVNVVRRGVPRGSFIEVCEATGGFEKLIFNPSIRRVLAGMQRGFFTIPSALMALCTVLIGTVSSLYPGYITGLRRKHTGTTLRAAAVTLAALTAVRSLLVGIPVYSLFYTKTMREKIEKTLIEELSHAIHCEEDFSFLNILAGVSSLSGEKYSEIEKRDIKKLEELALMMRTCNPRDIKWRQVMEEIANIRQLIGEVLSSGGKPAHNEGDDEKVVELKHSFDRLMTLLVDYRTRLRKKYSITFLDEWNKILEEKREKLLSHRIKFEEKLPDGIEGAKVHITADEFRYIISNLFENSIWALDSRDDGRIRIDVEINKNFLSLRWMDNGKGIEEDLKNQLFVAPVASTRKNGKGEGCYESRMILSRRGGLIRIEEAQEGWSTVIFIKLLRTG